MEEELMHKTQESIKKILDAGITSGNIDHLYRLAKTNHIAKEDMQMNYGNYNNYGRGYGRDEYGRDEYGARRRDSRGRYRGHEDLDRMYDDYGRYMENRERYGANDDTKRSLKYMLESMEDFARKLRQDAQSQEEVQMIRDTAQRIAQM